MKHQNLQFNHQRRSVRHLFLLALLVMQSLSLTGYAQNSDFSSVASYDSVYNSAKNLYVVPNDTAVYNVNSYSGDLSNREAKVGVAAADYSIEMLRTYANVYPGENVVVSPVSATMMYAMMSNFVKDDKDNIFKKNLKVDNSSTDDVNSYSRKLINHVKAMPANSKYYRLNTDRRLLDLLDYQIDTDCQLSNKVWMKQGATVYQSYLSTANFYDTEVEGVDFTNEDTPSLIYDQFHEQIDASDSKVGIDAMSLDNTNSMVTSSLSFEQYWSSSFQTDSVNQHFSNADGSVSDCKMLVGQKTAQVASFNRFQMMKFPFLEDNFSIFVVLPNLGSDISKCLADIQASGLSHCLAVVDKAGKQSGLLAKDTVVNIALPVFKSNMAVPLNPADHSVNASLSEMYSTNLPKVSPHGFSLDNMCQFCSVNLSEKGVNASAGSVVKLIELELPEIEVPDVVDQSKPGVGIITQTTPGGKPITGEKPAIESPVVIPFVVNRPFAFLVRENKQGAILLAGCINKVDPLKSTTDIKDSPRMMNGTDTQVYDLQGRRLESPRKGLNIVGGRKVVVK